MLLQKQREELITYGKKLVTTGLVSGSFGNLSVFDPESGLTAITPSGLDYFEIAPEDLVILDLDGNKIDGDRNPSSEYELHRIIYQNRPGIHAVVHTHSTFATTVACLQWTIEPVHYLIGYAGRDVPCTKYVPFGTRELAEVALDTMGDRFACLLGNHGLLAVGHDLSYAFDVAQQIEFVAELYYRARVAGTPVNLSGEYLDSLQEKFKAYTAQKGK